MKSSRLWAFTALVAAVLVGTMIGGTALAGWVNQKVLFMAGRSGGFVSTLLACNDQTSHPTNAATAQVELWNTNTTRDICISWSGTPDHTSLSTCDLVLGAYAGSGSPAIYATPSSVSLASTTFKCDADGGTNLRIVEFKGPTSP